MAYTFHAAVDGAGERSSVPSLYIDALRLWDEGGMGGRAGAWERSIWRRV